jgi:hypothetical protein
MDIRYLLWSLEIIVLLRFYKPFESLMIPLAIGTLVSLVLKKRSAY